MNRRLFTAGLMSLACVKPSIAGQFADTAAPSEIDLMAEFNEVWSRLDDDQRAVHLALLRGLAALPEFECSDHLFAEADRQLQIIRGRKS